MGHEDAVYLAKLAEQAERYEGSLLALSLSLFDGTIALTATAYRDG
jgi:hypothetical protein